MPLIESILDDKGHPDETYPHDIQVGAMLAADAIAELEEELGHPLGQRPANELLARARDRSGHYLSKTVGGWMRGEIEISLEGESTHAA